MSNVKACNNLDKLMQLRAGTGQVFQVNRVASGQHDFQIVICTAALSSGFLTPPDDSHQPREPTSVCPTGRRILTLFLHSMHEWDASAAAPARLRSVSPVSAASVGGGKNRRGCKKKKKKCCRDVISARRVGFLTGKQQLVEVNTTHASVHFLLLLLSRTNNEAAYNNPART